MNFVAKGKVGQADMRTRCTVVPWSRGGIRMNFKGFKNFMNFKNLINFKN